MKFFCSKVLSFSPDPSWTHSWWAGVHMQCFWLHLWDYFIFQGYFLKRSFFSTVSLLPACFVLHIGCKSWCFEATFRAFPFCAPSNPTPDPHYLPASQGVCLSPCPPCWCQPCPGLGQPCQEREFHVIKTQLLLTVAPLLAVSPKLRECGTITPSYGVVVLKGQENL